MFRSHSQDVRFANVIRIRNEFPTFYSADALLNAETFLNILSTNNVWGDIESRLAIAIMFVCDVQVFYEGGSSTIISDENSISTSQVSLVYRCPLGPGLWNHYDSFLDFIDDAAARNVKRLLSGASWSTISFNGGSCFALHALPDGNCMFSAIEHQLFGLEIDSP